MFEEINNECTFGGNLINIQILKRRKRFLVLSFSLIIKFK